MFYGTVSFFPVLLIKFCTKLIFIKTSKENEIQLKYRHFSRNRSSFIWVQIRSDRKKYQHKNGNFVLLFYSRKNCTIFETNVGENASYCFISFSQGDLEQMTISPDPSMVSLQCSTQRTPIIDPSVKDIEDDKAEKITTDRKKMPKKVKENWLRPLNSTVKKKRILYEILYNQNIF